MMGDMCGRRGRGRGGELLISMITSSSSSPPSSSSSSTATTTPVHLKRQRHNPARRRPRTERTNAHDTPFESPRCPLSSKPTWRSPSEVNDRRHSIQSKDLPVPQSPPRTCRHTTICQRGRQFRVGQLRHGQVLAQYRMPTTIHFARRLLSGFTRKRTSRAFEWRTMWRRLFRLHGGSTTAATTTTTKLTTTTTTTTNRTATSSTNTTIYSTITTTNED